MSDLREEKSHTKVAKLLAPFKERALPVVQETSSIQEVIDAMIRCKHSRVLFVLNDEGQLSGTISLGALVRQVFSRRHGPQIHPRVLIGMITANLAKDIMQAKPLFATGEEEVGAVLKRMLESNLKEIPILDKEQKVVGDLTMIDLLQFLSVPTKE